MGLRGQDRTDHDPVRDRIVNDGGLAASILPKKTYVSVLENREFGAVNIKKGELRIGLDLGDRPFDSTVEKAKLTGPMPRISHMVVATDPTRFDVELAALLRESHARCH